MERKSKQAQPSPPKRPINSFMIYRGMVYDEMKKKNQDLKLTEITKLIGDQFRKLEGKEKEKIENQAKKLKQQYENDMAEYRKKYGEPPKKSRSKSSEPKSLKQKKEKPQKAQNQKKEQPAKAEKGKEKKKK